MPNFRAELEEFRSGDAIRDPQIGNLYRILIAPPNDPTGGPSRDAFFFPDDHETIMGTSVAREFQIGRIHDDDLVVLSLRSMDPLEKHQTDLHIRAGDVQVKDTRDPYYIKIGDVLLFSKLTITDWGPPFLYASAPPAITLTDLLYLKNRSTSACYDPFTRRAVAATP